MCFVNLILTFYEVYFNELYLVCNGLYLNKLYLNQLFLTHQSVGTMVLTAVDIEAHKTKTITGEFLDQKGMNVWTETSLKPFIVYLCCKHSCSAHLYTSRGVFEYPK